MTFTNMVVLKNAGANGPLEVFVLGTDHKVYHRWQSSTGPGGWAPWANIGGSLKTLLGAQNSDGHLEVFGTGTDNALWHSWQDPQGPGGWHAWQSLGNP
jgi:hypothetical protein